MEVDMAQFKRNSSSNLGADFPNRFILYMLWDSEEANRSTVLLFICLDDFYKCNFVQMLQVLKFLKQELSSNFGQTIINQIYSLKVGIGILVITITLGKVETELSVPQLSRRYFWPGFGESSLWQKKKLSKKWRYGRFIQNSYFLQPCRSCAELFEILYTISLSLDTLAKSPWWNKDTAIHSTNRCYLFKHASSNVKRRKDWKLVAQHLHINDGIP